MAINETGKCSLFNGASGTQEILIFSLPFLDGNLVESPYGDARGNIESILCQPLTGKYVF
jgi:hypothetical protein